MLRRSDGFLPGRLWQSKRNLQHLHPQVTSSVVGKITALDGTTATLQLGELTKNQPSDPPSQDSTQSGGDNANGDSSASSTQTPPEKPEGDTQDRYSERQQHTAL